MTEERRARITRDVSWGRLLMLTLSEAIQYLWEDQTAHLVRDEWGWFVEFRDSVTIRADGKGFDTWEEAVSAVLECKITSAEEF